MSDFKYRITNDEDYKVMIKKLDNSYIVCSSYISILVRNNSV